MCRCAYPHFPRIRQRIKLSVVKLVLEKESNFKWNCGLRIFERHGHDGMAHAVASEVSKLNGCFLTRKPFPIPNNFYFQSLSIKIRIFSFGFVISFFQRSPSYAQTVITKTWVFIWLIRFQGKCHRNFRYPSPKFPFFVLPA